MRRIHSSILGALLLAGCASTDIAPMQSASDVNSITANEKRVWAEADNYDLSMRNAGNVYENPAILSYLQGIMDRVHPDFKGTIKVRVANSPHLNAFALPNGAIYVNVGLIARLENEAQRATVLAHEGGHFILKHGYKQRQNVKNSAAVSLFVSEILAMSSIYGYSRDLEREADMIAFEQIIKAGYDSKEAIRAFEHLANEAKALNEKEPFFFSSHPKLAERIDVYKDLNKASKNAGGEIGKERYNKNVAALRITTLEGDLSMNRYKSVILVLEDKKRLAEYPPEAGFFLAEAYQRRGDKGDEQKAIDAYLATMKVAPAYAPSYRALGVHHLKKAEYGKAESYLARYLQLAPQAPDRDHVRNYHQLSKQKGAK